MSRRGIGMVGILLATAAIAYVVALRSGSLAALDLEATSDPRTGEFRSVPTLLPHLSFAWLGAAFSLALLALAVLVQALHVGGMRVAIRTSSMVFGCLATGEAAKWILGETTPLGNATMHEAAASFPSVHSAVAIVLAVGLARLAPGRAALPLGCAYATGMGAFTVVAGWHYPSDVVGGCLLGAAWATGIPRSSRSHGVAAVAVVAAAGAALVTGALLAGYTLSFGRPGIHGEAFAAGALAIAAAAAVAAALSTRQLADRNPRPSSGVAGRAGH